MPILHRWLGNPMSSILARRMFFAEIHDVYCGLRGFTRELHDRLQLRCTGMEFATEMIIKSSIYGTRVAEVPITLHPDGRKSHKPHLKTFRDGWRTLRFFLMYSPRWLFLYPGLAAVFVGLVGYGLALPGLTAHGVTFDAHTLLICSLSILLGYQSIVFAIFAKTFAISEGLLPQDRRMERFYEIVNLERGLIIAVAALVFGLVLLDLAVNQWRLHDFGRLDYAYTMRFVIPGVTMNCPGFSNNPIWFLCQHNGNASEMSVTARLHGHYVHRRRVRVLCDHLAPLIPSNGRVLDVGCGDGLLASLILERRRDAEICGIDVLVRENTRSL